ncbi:MAG: NlpC/P60 family protein [Lachnospiraceae bacterium]|nr:NlpC/P60 family protein [Lachnospiraceae bacterium]
MSYRKLKMLFPAALALSLTVPGGVMAAPASGQVENIVEELIIEDKETTGEEVQEPVEETEAQEEVLPQTGEIILEEGKTADPNEVLISSQQITTPPVAEKTFRFMKVGKKYAIAKRQSISFYEKKDEDSIVVGDIVKRGIVYILSEEEDGWVYAESGRVRGFVRKDMLITGSPAEKYIENKGEQKMKVAEELIEPLDNEALDYKKTTVYETVVKKKYAIAQETMNIFDEVPDEENLPEADDFEEKPEDAEVALEESEESDDPSVVGQLEKGGVCYVLADTSERWVYVESGDVRGFADAELLMRGKDAKDIIKDEGEENLLTARQNIEPEKNKACYYTLTSVKEASVSGLIRSSMITFAEQFLGNPYVWGGTSLTNGADCSGFVQSIYAEFGYRLPRVAEDQAKVGMKIPVQDAAPGDLIFYARDGEIYHVVMSLGNGKTIEAQGSATGIVYSSVNYTNAVWATRIISDEDTDILDRIRQKGMGDVYTEYTSTGYTYGKYLGNFKLTSYCACPICCGVWSGGPTASGAIPIEGRTVAMAGVPFGTKLIIDGFQYTVEDRGTPYGHVDIYKNSHQDALNFGVRYADVYLAE